MKRGKWRAHLRGLVLASLVAVLAWSAGGKLFWPTDFQRLISTWGLIPPTLIPAIAHAVPVLELLLALGLVVRRLRVLALFGLLYLALCFAGVHAFLTYSGTVVPCGCAGLALSFSSRPGHIALLTLSSVMAFVAAVLLLTLPSNQDRNWIAHASLADRPATPVSNTADQIRRTAN